MKEMGFDMHNSRDYKALALWHKSSGSMQYYIDALQDKASNDFAPVDALHKRESGEWVCVSDLHPDHPFRDKYLTQLRNALLPLILNRKEKHKGDVR